MSHNSKSSAPDLSIERLSEITRRFGGIVELKKAIRILKEEQEVEEPDVKVEEITAVISTVERHERTKFPASIRLQRKLLNQQLLKDGEDATTAGPNQETDKEAADETEYDRKREHEIRSLGDHDAEPTSQNLTTLSSNKKKRKNHTSSYWLVCPDTTKEVAACANENHVHENGKRGESWKALELLYTVSQEVAVEEARRHREEVIESNSGLEVPPPVEINERMGSEALNTLLVTRGSCDDTNQDLMKLHKRLVHAAAYYVRCHEELAPKALSLSSFNLMLRRPCSLPLVERMIEGLLQPHLRACWKSGRWTLNAPKAQEITNRVTWMCFTDEMPDILHDLSTSADITKIVQSTEGAVRGILGRLADAVGLSQIGAMRWSAADLGRLVGIVPSGRLTLNNCLSAVELDVKCLQQAEAEENGGEFAECTSMSASVRIVPMSKKKSTKKGKSPSPALNNKSEGIQTPSGATLRPRNDEAEEDEQHGAQEDSPLVPRRKTLQPGDTEGEEPFSSKEGRDSDEVQDEQLAVLKDEEEKEAAGLEVVLQEASDSNALANLEGLELLRQVANEEGLTHVPPSPQATHGSSVKKRDRNGARLVSADESAKIQGMKKHASPRKRRVNKGYVTAEPTTQISHPLPWQSDTSLGSQTHVHAILSGISDEEVRKAGELEKNHESRNSGDPATRKLLGKVLAKTLDPSLHRRHPKLRSVSATPTTVATVAPGRELASLPPLKEEDRVTRGRKVHSSLAMVTSSSGNTTGNPTPYGSSTKKNRSHSSLAGSGGGRTLTSSSKHAATPEVSSLALTAEPKGKTPTFKLPPLKPVKAYAVEKPVGLEHLLGDILRNSGPQQSSTTAASPSKQNTSSSDPLNDRSTKKKGPQKKKEFQSSAASIVVRAKVPQRTLQRKAKDNREVKDRDLEDFIMREARHPKDARLRPLHLDIK